MNSIDFNDEAAVKEYIDRLGVEYRFQCFSEGRTDGCHRLADWLEFCKKDWTKAGRVFKNNCLLHDYGHSCFKYANYALLGKGIKKNGEDAAGFYRRGCNSKTNPYPSACYNYGLMIAKGDLQVEEPTVESRQYFEKGCELDDGGSCGGAVTSCLQTELKDFTRAFHLAQKGCSLNDLQSCRVLSGLYRKGDGCEKNEQLAQEYEEKSERLLNEMTEERPNVTFGR